MMLADDTAVGEAQARSSACSEGKTNDLIASGYADETTP